MQVDWQDLASWHVLYGIYQTSKLAVAPTDVVPALTPVSAGHPVIPAMISDSALASSVLEARTEAA